MFSIGFRKVAVAVVTMTPEEYFDTVGEKDPLVGTVGGAAAGTLYGLRKGKKGARSKAALIGNLAGGVGGAVVGHYAGKAVRGHQTRKVHRLAHDLKLRSTPNRAAYRSEEE